MDNTETQDNSKQEPIQEKRFFHHDVGISDERNIELRDLAMTAIDKLRDNDKALTMANIVKANAEIPGLDTLEAIYVGFLGHMAYAQLEAQRAPLKILESLLRATKSQS